MEFMWFSSWRMRRCPRWWKVPPGLFLTFCFLLQNRTYKMNIISLSKAFFFPSSFARRASLQLYFGIQPFWDMKVLSEHWSTLSTKSSCIKSLFFSLSHPHTYIHFLFFCFLSLPHFKKKKKKNILRVQGLPGFLPPSPMSCLKSINLKVE